MHKGLFENVGCVVDLLLIGSIVSACAVNGFEERMCTHTHTHTYVYTRTCYHWVHTHTAMLLHTDQAWFFFFMLLLVSLLLSFAGHLLTTLYLIPQSSLLMLSVFESFFPPSLSTNLFCLLCLWPPWQACWVKLGATWSPWPGSVGLVPVCQHDLRPCCQLSSYSSTPSYTVNRSRLSAATRTVILVLAWNSVWCRRWDQTW